MTIKYGALKQGRNMEVTKIEDTADGGAIIDLTVDTIELKIFAERGLTHLSENLSNLTEEQTQFLAEIGINAALKDHIKKVQNDPNS